MAKAKKKNPGQLGLRMGLKDERLPKLFGVLLLICAVYLGVAFLSYLFTWKVDQDRVLRFSWKLLLADGPTVDNWLGRLGAFLSNFYIYYLFGLPSFGLIYLLWMLGLNRLRRQPLRLMGTLFVKVMLAILALAVLLEFAVGGWMQFPIGGGIGKYLVDHLTGVLGSFGVILLLLALVGLYLVFEARIDFNGSPRQIRTDIVDHFSERIRFRGKPSPERFDAPGTGSAFSAPSNPPLAPAAAPPPPKSAPGSLSPGDGSIFEVDGPELETDRDFEQPRGSQMKMPLDAVGDLTLVSHDPLSIGKDNLIIADGDTGIDTSLAVTEENQDHSEPYDPTLDLPSYESPHLQLLLDRESGKAEVDRAELETNKDQIIETLLNYKIEITKIRATIGPTVTLYEIVPAPGVRISRIKNLEDDIALSLAALGIRIIAPIPGRGTIGIEVPNKNPQMVGMREVLESEKFRTAKMDLPLVLGKTIKNEVLVADLAKMPHLLVAGATGQGKSVGINSIIMSLLYKKHPSQVKLVMIDPKKVELFPYAKLESHFLAFLPGQTEPITTETTKVIHILNSLCIEMDQRYDLLKKAAARNIKEYNEKFVARRLNPEKGHKFLPFIVLIIDEFADLIMTAGKEVEMPIARLAQLSRAVGIHLVIATQRPSVNIITGVIKANFPARIAYKVTAKVDSRTILDAGGADQLIGRGDMLLSNGGDVVRLQGAFIDTPEVEEVIDFIANQRGYVEPYLLPEYNTDEEMAGSSALTYADLDDMLEDAAKLIIQQQHGSTSMVQRRLKLGYNRAGRIMDQLEQLGIVGPAVGSKPREVLVYDEQELIRFIDDLRNRG
ncbi:DNA translocase FtsK 4TM domain-containing protein [Neolewinella lacunae]|uniref:DNA translocase FtsK 4TM domain-containing protein n=1 Tax=Neolewinella lacunae TaxID=1517758 RepID=A0A923PGR7_9BACT|nr:DNA translocase FtsK [Neolewinella lacunae]MBC6992984.1 DNA translocase FtsK 4TM domain-containing protein [Neolewinella lacunae]MDN3635774.1 DNA translocase FtsK 4TM domain-containing protein [Neolewinella lacunae]